VEEQTDGNSDDGGEVWYSLNGTTKQFEILYHATSGDPTIDVQIYFDTLGNSAGSKIPLSWQHNQDSPFILASSGTDLSSASFISNNPPQNWMTSTYDRISCLTLRELAMPGTHDSGMSEFNQGVGLATAGETDAQIQNIAGQLTYGARWFDIRPVIAGGHWATGHYGWSCIIGDSFCGWRGGNGQSIASVIDQVNSFTAGDSESELIILSLSHGLNTDIFGADEYNHLTQDNWDELLPLLLQINYLVKGIDSSQDLTKLPVSHLIENGPAVIIIVDDNIAGTANARVNISSFIEQGIFSTDQFPTIGSYADKSIPNDVIEDQLQKMLNLRTSPESEMFVLSWILTHEGIDALALGGIIGAAVPFNKALFKNLWINMDSNTYPNMLIVDAYPENGDIAALAMAINYYFAPTCPGPGSGSSNPPPSKPSITSSSATSSSASSNTYSTPSPTPYIVPPSNTTSNSSYSPIVPGTCGTNLLVCEVQDPTRLEAPWAGVSEPFPQCYDPSLYVCSGNFLCPVDAPKIQGEYACGTSLVSQKIAGAIMCGLGYC